MMCLKFFRNLFFFLAVLAFQFSVAEESIENLTIKSLSVADKRAVVLLSGALSVIQKGDSLNIGENTYVLRDVVQKRILFEEYEPGGQLKGYLWLSTEEPSVQRLSFLQ